MGMRLKLNIRHRAFVLVSLLCVSFVTVAAPDAALKPLQVLLQAPEQQLDLAQAKLTIDRMIVPTEDVAAISQQMDALAATVKSRFPPGASNKTKLDVLLSTLYTPGPWNSNRPFRYDLDDPMGTNRRNKLLSTYLATRKGNCVSMPVLFAILGQKLGLKVTLATAPAHLLVKYLADDGQWLNVEATAGGFKYDTSYERETGISQKAIENALYLRPLTQRESVAAMTTTLMEFYGAKGQQTRRIAVADMALAVDSKDVVAMLHKATAYAYLLDERYRKKYPRPVDIPADKQEDYKMLNRENSELFAKAEALGWSEPTQAQDTAYLNNIQKEKVKQGAKR